MALPADEVARRIKAARRLRGLSQVELGKRVHGDGLGESDVGRIERMDPKLPFSKALRLSICEHLRVPERWLLAEDVDEIVGYGGGADSVAAQVGQVLRLVEDLVAKRASLTGENAETDTIEQLLDVSRALARRQEELAARLGRDRSRRDLESKRAQGPPPEASSASG